ncbi:MAG: hypothetical protein A4E72_00751 [Syntrophus sp. PtaU1.Bin208]|nr:MAG: hypothetical protein A4E72_00751 [Syntrophus sp. PtaU1.Bin208]
MKKIEIFVLGILALFLASCASTRPPQFYTLTPSLMGTGATSASLSISVGPVSIPADVDRPQIVVRTGQNQVLLAEFDRWALPLKSDIARVIAENLATMLGTPQVSVFPQSSAAESTYRVGVDVLRFESELGKGAALDVLWTVNSRKTGQTRSHRTTMTEPAPGEGYAEVVAAHSLALGRLSGEIAEAIRAFEAQKP